jgi:hypothetical protein
MSLKGRHINIKTRFDYDYAPYLLGLRSGIQYMIEDFESLRSEYENRDSKFGGFHRNHRIQER